MLNICQILLNQEKEYEKDNNFGIYVCRAGIDIVQRFLG